MSETFVDVSSRGVELGRRLHMSEIGPTGAYLEHPVPMPVGSELRLQTDGGLEIGVVVARVCEQVAGAERPPGMFVRVVELEGEAESWWKQQRTADVDPIFPESARTPPTDQRATIRLKPEEIAAVTHEGLQRPAAINESEIEVVDPEPEKVTRERLEAEPERAPLTEESPDPDSDGSNGAGSTLKGFSAVAALAAAEEGRAIPDVKATVKMTADQIKSITDNAPEGDDSESSKGKRRKRRRKKKKKS